MVRKIKMDAYITVLIIANAGSMVVDSFTKWSCCHSYVLFFALSARDQIYHVGRTTREYMSDGIYCFCAGAFEVIVCVNMLACDTFRMKALLDFSRLSLG